MGRDLTKTTELHLDHAYGIRKICNGNLKYFYDTWIDKGVLSISEFYTALKYLVKISPEVEREIDEAYFMALSQFGLTHEDLAITPTFEKFLIALDNDLSLAESLEQFKHVKATHLIRLGFYKQMIDRNLIKIEKTKKSRLV
jgi:hypothetical protein